MKILIIGFSKLKYLPYLNFYFDNINRNNNQVQILYWNRDLKDENVDKYSDAILHEFKYKQNDDCPKIFKLIGFYKYTKCVKKIMSSEEFDFIISLHTMPAVLIEKSLRTTYKEKYIFDYRDYTYENIHAFRKIIFRIVRNSAATFISSEGFLKLMPQDCLDKIHLSHNVSVESLKHRNVKLNTNDTHNRIRISFWGLIRNENLNKEIIRKISKDPRFELHYYGREQKIALNLKKFSKKIKARNVFFHGEYVSEDRYKFASHTDLLDNIYNDFNAMMATGNKYYDGAIFYLPQLCMKNSRMGMDAEKYGIGYECNPFDDDFTNKIFAYYSNISTVDFKNACDTEIRRIECEYEKGCQIIKKLCNH